MELISEIFLENSTISNEAWMEFIKTVSSYQGLLKKWSVIITIEKNEIRYYAKTKYNLPSTIHNLSELVLKQTDDVELENYIRTFPLMISKSNLIDVIEYFEIKKRNN